MWYPTTIFTPLALYPVAKLSNVQARENQRKVGKTVREMDGDNHFIYRAHTCTICPCGVSTRTNPLPSELMVRQKCWCAHFTYSTLQCPAWTDALEKHPLVFLHRKQWQPIICGQATISCPCSCDLCLSGAQPLCRVGREGSFLWESAGAVCAPLLSSLIHCNPFSGCTGRVWGLPEQHRTQFGDPIIVVSCRYM